MGQGLWLIFHAILQYKHAYQPVDTVMYELYLWVIIFWRNAGHSKSIEECTNAQNGSWHSFNQNARNK